MVKSNMDKQIRLPERWPNYKHPVLPFTFSLVVLLGLLACSNFQNSQGPGLPAAETPTTTVESSSKGLRGIESVPTPTQVTLLPETDTPVTVLEPTPSDLPAPVRVPPPNHRPKLPVADTPATPVAPTPTGQPVPASVPPPTKQPPGQRQHFANKHTNACHFFGSAQQLQVFRHHRGPRPQLRITDQRGSALLGQQSVSCRTLRGPGSASPRSVY